MAESRRSGRPKVTSHARAKFIATLRKTGIVTDAALVAGHTRKAFYRLREADPAFADEWRDALDEATDSLEKEARRRAIEGCDRPIYQRGQLVGYEREYSDTLMCLLLKAHRPMVFRERVEHDIGHGAANTIADLVRRASGRSGSDT